MSRINKTQNNLQSVWNNLDLAYGHMERAIEDLSQMTGLSDEFKRMAEQYNSGLRLIREMGYRHVSGEPAVKYYCMCNGY